MGMSVERGAKVRPGQAHLRVVQWASERVAGILPPRGLRPFVRLHLRGFLVWLVVLLGFLGELVLMYLVWQLVDLTISLMEVWAELARKHLEITLS
jgi:hypothetical protein